MGCGNSSPTATNASSGGSRSSTAGEKGRAEAPTTASNESPEDDKRKNYGGVYVGLPTDLSNIPQVQIGALRECRPPEAAGDMSSLRKPLWGNGF